jgi:hypothetical protein
MIHVCVTDEHVADLVCQPRRQSRPFPQVEQQAAPPVAQAHMQQGIAKHAVDQAHAQPPYAPCRARPRHGGRRRMWQNIRRRQIGKPVRGKRLDRAEKTVCTACGITHKQ